MRRAFQLSAVIVVGLSVPLGARAGSGGNIVDEVLIGLDQTCPAGTKPVRVQCQRCVREDTPSSGTTSSGQSSSGGGTRSSSPDLVLGNVEVGCFELKLDRGVPKRGRQEKCWTKSRLELKVTITNAGRDTVSFTGKLWEIEGKHSAIQRAAASPTRRTYSKDVVMRGLSTYPRVLTLPKQRTWSLKPGESVRETVVLTQRLVDGDYSFTVRVDPDNKVSERSESNNTRSITLKLKPRDQTKGEWLHCPSQGLATVDASFSNGFVQCVYRHRKSRDVVDSKTLPGKFRGCLRSNDVLSRDGDASVSGSAFCSRIDTVATLVRKAWGWSTNVARAIRVGFRLRRSGKEPLYTCRAKLGASWRFGKAWRGRCYISTGHGVAKLTRFEYLVLRERYGLPWFGPASHVFQKMPEHTLKLGDAAPGKPVFVCIASYLPTNYFEGVTYVRSPGILLPGTPCVSTIQGKNYVNPREPAGTILMLK